MWTSWRPTPPPERNADGRALGAFKLTGAALVREQDPGRAGTRVVHGLETAALAIDELLTRKECPR
jgi:hypothetical protein